MTEKEIEKIVFNQIQEGKSNVDYSNISITNKDYAENPDCSNDNVNHPSHYQSKSSVQIECIDAMRAAFGNNAVASFCLCNAMKYIYRCETNGGNTDIRKAIWYLNKYLDLNGKQ